MIYGLYSIHDLKAGYLAPTLDTNDDTALRNFRHAAQRVDSLFYSHPGDYQLERCGAFDVETGELILEDHKLIARASDFVEVSK